MGLDQAVLKGFESGASGEVSAATAKFDTIVRMFLPVALMKVNSPGNRDLFQRRKWKSF